MATAGGTMLRAADAPQPHVFSTSVRTLPEPPVAKPKPDAATKMPTQPSTASNVPPQYRARSNGRGELQATPDDPAVRFIVPLALRPALVEARITIDGKPFRMLREERVGELATDLNRPEPESTPTAAATADNAEQSSAETPVPSDDSLPARLRRYAVATQRQPGRDELRWLLTNWAEGPVLLVLDGNFSRIRADQAPLFKTLDQDEDGVISAAEIAAAQDTLLKYDRNQDEVISLDELAVEAARTPDKGKRHATEPPPLIALEDLAHTQVLARLAERYSSQGATSPDAWSRFYANGDGCTDDAELAELRKTPPDLQIDVAFDSGDANRSRLDVAILDASLGEAPATVRGSSITLLAAGTLLELSAVQSSDGGATDFISLGAVRDGYPLLPELDANEDGRLTLREIRQAPKRLASFDRDGDGAISAGELKPTLRVAIGRGATVHRALALVRSLHPPVAAPAVELPDWFVRMDRNNDGDVSRREFLGGRRQFKALDTDGDELISGEESAGNEKPLSIAD